MPTAHPRIQVTCDPRLERVLRIGRERWPGRRPGAILVGLAEERADQLAMGGLGERPDPALSLLTFNGPRISMQEIQDIIDDED
ncbi:MAG: hypothetical protein FWD59_07675 [Micrococcales bacterium]|nr:hypothetical protein [Micrococcales bacterium]